MEKQERTFNWRREVYRYANISTQKTKKLEEEGRKANCITREMRSASFQTTNFETFFPRRCVSALEALLAYRDQWNDENTGGEEEEEAGFVEKLAGDDEIDDVLEFLDILRGDDDRVIDLTLLTTWGNRGCRSAAHEPVMDNARVMEDGERVMVSHEPVIDDARVSAHEAVSE